MKSWRACLLASVAALIGAQHAPDPAQGGAHEVPAAEAARGQPADVAAPAPGDAAALLALFSRMEGLQARFEEDKFLALLAAPLSCRGTLYYLKPGHLTRIVEAPEPSTLCISPDTLRMTDSQGVETIDLRVSADLRAFVHSLLQVLSGDESALRAAYEVGFEAREGTWSLTLAPREPPLTAMLTSLQLSGSGHTVTQIVVIDPQGDRTVTRVTSADVERRFTKDELWSIFGIREP